MRITVDETRCVAAGLCVTAEDTVFDQDEETGIVSLLTDSPPPRAWEAVREAARICPALAIAIHEGPGATSPSGSVPPASRRTPA